MRLTNGEKAAKEVSGRVFQWHGELRECMPIGYQCHRCDKLGESKGYSCVRE